MTESELSARAVELGFDPPSREALAERRQLLTFIEYAPRDPGPLAADLRGWWTPAGWYICNHCAGRIMARGCHLPTGSAPAWDGEPMGVCQTCGEGDK